MKVIVLSTVGLLAVSAVSPAQVNFTAYPVPTGSSRPYGITKGPDGNIWFTEIEANKIGRVTPAGVITEFPVIGGNVALSGSCTVYAASSYPTDITTGPDGNLWFTEYCGEKIARITPTGVVTEFPIPTSNSFPYGITIGPDGNLWFSESGVADGTVGPIGGNNIGRITPMGVITEFPIPTARSAPEQIVTGPDGNLWFTEGYIDRIGRITTTGVISEFVVPTSGGTPVAIAAGPDGNLWFGEYHGDKIGRITPAGIITEFPIPSSSSFVNGIAAGPDGNMWFTETGNGKIGRITLAGVITEFMIPAGGSPIEITQGPDGNLWLTNDTGNSIVRVNVCSAPFAGLTATPGALGAILESVASCGVAPPAVSKTFGASTIAVNGVTSLTFTIRNPNTTSLTGVAAIDTLPSGIVVAMPNNVSSNCGGTTRATVGSGTVTISGVTLNADVSCTLSVNVVGITPGVKYNVVSITSNEGGDGTNGTATLNVVIPPSITKAFTDSQLQVLGPGNTTALTFTITNPNSFASMNGIAYTDTLPSGLVVGSPNGLTGSCGGGAISATAASSSISLSGASLAASTSCTFSVNVSTLAVGVQINTTSSVTAEGGTIVGNTATDITNVNDLFFRWFFGESGGGAGH